MPEPIELSPLAAADLRLLAVGAYAPLDGFMTRADYLPVIQHAQLASGAPWTIPIALPTNAVDARNLHDGERVALHVSGMLLGHLTVRDVFERDPQEIQEVFRTVDESHPGVRATLEGGPILVGGEVEVAEGRAESSAMSPAATRAVFSERGWSTVVGFQTRNPIHRAHEYLTKVALEQADGLLLHPLSGVTKDDDVPFSVRMRCYEVLVREYYPQDRVLLTPWPAAMRYAGPREAIFHGLVRRNYGCSHFIIGRDAAGVGSFYGPYDAQHLYDELGGADRLGFTALKFDQAFFCRRCEAMASTRSCPHTGADRIVLSGSQLRDMLRRGEAVPPEFTRPEVAEILREAYADRETDTA